MTTLDLVLEKIQKDEEAHNFSAIRHNQISVVPRGSVRKGSHVIQGTIHDVFLDSWEDIQAIIEYHDPAFSAVGGPRQLAIWPNIAARKEGEKKRLRGKPGKIFAKMFPFAKQEQIRAFAEKYNEQFLAGEGLEIFQSQDRADFKRVYTADSATYMNPVTTSARKNLAMSCMRYDFDALPAHPCEAYGSGEFTIIWCEQDGDIAARCVVWTKPDVPQAGPIYGVSESAIDIIENHLRGMGAESFGDADWSGARLLAIQSDEGQYVAPYIDQFPRSAGLSHCGRYLVLTGCGNYDLDEADGLIDDHGTECPCCGDRVDPDRMTYVVGRDEHICDGCVSEHYTQCDHCDELTHVDYIGAAFNRNGHRIDVCESCLDSHFTYTDSGENWPDNCIVETEQGSVFNTVTESDEYFKSDLSGLFHDISEKETGSDGRVATAEDFEDEGYIYNPVTDIFYIDQHILPLEIAA